MASKKCDNTFVDDVSRLMCSICLDVAEDPKQHDKCGKIFCSKCCAKVSERCPSCRGEKPNYFTDERGAQEIRELKIRCTNVNEGCEWKGTGETLEKHLTTCNFKVVACKYDYVGCNEKMMRKDIKDHEENDVKHHLDLALQSTAIPTLSHGEYFVFKMTEFSSKKQNNEVFLSNPFYTHSNGYKMQFKIYTNGKGSCKGSHLSVSSCLLRGPFDKSLQWPFSGIVRFNILDPGISDTYYNKRFVYKDGKHGHPGESQDIDDFITHSSLSAIFVKHDMVYFRVTVKFSENLPWLECGKQVYPKLSSLSKTYVDKDPLIFNVDNYSNRKSNGIWFTSSSFFTHPQGYRMFIRIYPGGTGEDKGEYLSVYVNMIGGPYDAKLSWPFLGMVKLELLNQLSDADHHAKSFSITRENGMFVDKNRGYPQFIKNGDLQCGDRQYLMNDTLYFRVSVTVDSHKPWLTCTPMI